jgi:hypothetical protein
MHAAPKILSTACRSSLVLGPVPADGLGRLTADRIMDDVHADDERRNVMSRLRGLPARVIFTLATGAVVVVLPGGLELLLLVAWSLFIVRWATRQARVRSIWRAMDEFAIHVAIMTAVIAAALAFPCKTVESVKARRFTVPKPEMSIAELQEPWLHGLRIPLPVWVSDHDHEGLSGRVIHFPSQELTVVQFIQVIEAQTPLKHRFRHCGNGHTILWGADCSFGLSFD